MRRIDALVARLAAVAILGLSGCCYYELRDNCDECLCNLKADHLARKAWCRCSDAYDNHPNEKLFGRGFKDGYSNVAKGGDGCCPTIPPRDCWSVCYDGCEGHQRMNAWFDGYAAGAIAAQVDGVAVCGQIAFHRPACPTGCVSPRTMSPYGAGTAPAPVDTMSPALGPVIGAPTPPPPAPPSLSPTGPAGEAYDSYDEGGLYYE